MRWMFLVVVLIGCGSQAVDDVPSAPEVSAEAASEDEDVDGADVAQGEDAGSAEDAPDGEGSGEGAAPADAAPGDDGPAAAPAPATPAPAPTPTKPTDQAPAPAGTSCLSARDCGAGSVCEGRGCGDDTPGTCQPAARRCTKDLRPYCGCDGQTFQGSTSCPGKRFAARGACGAGE